MRPLIFGILAMASAGTATLALLAQRWEIGVPAAILVIVFISLAGEKREN